MALLLVSKNLEDLILLQVEKGGADERLDELERSRAGWEAEIEASILKADSTLKSASNAESRSRTMLRHAEKLSDPFSENGDEVEERLPPLNAVPGAPEGVLPLREDLEILSPKQQALRMKFS